jgi:hypothetical protein
MRVSIARVASMTSDTDAGTTPSVIAADQSIPTVAFANKQIHGMAGSAARQLASADELFAMGGDAKSVAEALLLAVGTFRFAVHARAEREIAGLLEEISRTDLARQRLEHLMEGWIQQHGHFELVYFTDPVGRQIVDNIACADRQVRREAGYNRDWSGRPWYQNALASTRTCATDLYRSTATGDFCFTISCALREHAGGVRGVLGADVNFQQLLAR